MNYLTGVSSEFVTFFEGRLAEERVEIGAEYGVLHYIVRHLTTPSTTIVRLTINDIPSEQLQQEVLHLLQLGAGAVTASGDIILVKDIVNMIFDEDRARAALLGILRGTLDALRAQPIQNPDIQIARAAQDVDAELSRLLRELGVTE